MNMNIRIIRVIGIRAGITKATVLAIANEHVVRWTPRAEWSCDCDETEHPDCPHIPAVEQLIDPRVTQKVTT